MRAAAWIVACVVLSGCAGGATAPASNGVSLEGTFWKLAVLGGAIPTVDTTLPVPHIVFDSEGGRVHGNGGCNRFSGTFVREGDTLRIDPGAATRMACANLDLEGAFFAALAHARFFEVRGQVLELRDASTSLLARFAAQPLR